MLNRLSILMAGATLALAGAAHAECSGSFGRGWSKGEGNGTFQMAAADRHCVMGWTYFKPDQRKDPATQISLTRAPASGQIGTSKGGIVYTPNPGFRGEDRFCLRNTAPRVSGAHRGCVTVMVR